MELKIYTKSGSLRMVAASGDNDRATSGIQQESMLYLSFTAFECVPIEVYDYVDFAGARYWATERYRPKMTARNEWTYNLQMHGIEGLAAQTLIVNPTDGKDDPLVTLTAPAREHAALIVANLNRKMNTTIWKVGQVVVSEYIHIEYTGKYASDALSELAEAAKTEWWFDGTTLNISRCEFGEPVSLSYGDGLVGGIAPTVADGVKFFTRLFPVGSSRNIDPDRYGYARLQLPDHATYVEQDTYLGIVEHYEQEAFAEIYPRRIGLVGSVRHVEKKGEDGDPFTIWYFTDPDIPFNPNDYEIGGLVKQVTFQSGELRGRTFEVNYDAQAKEFEIITQWPYDDEQQLPTPPLVPETGDEYVLWNIALPESYYTAAEQEFRQAVETFMDESRKDVSVFSAQTDFTVVEARKLNLRPGQRVRIHNTQLFPETGYRDTRIVSISRSVTTPGSMNISMSDVLSTGRISRIESDIVRVEQLTRSISTEMPDIIRSWEETPASDSALYSSRKSEREFLNKRKGGTVEEDVRFAKDIFVGGTARSAEFAAGMTGYGYGFGPDGHGEVESMLIRRFLEVPELRYNRTDITVGDQWRAAGVGLVAEVTVESATGGIITLKLEEGEAGTVHPGDICMGIFHSLDEQENAMDDFDDSLGNRRFAGFATVYFGVDELLDDGARFRYTLRPASEKYPKPIHPKVSMTFVCYGSFTDAARRSSVYATRTYERYLKDVDSWEFSAENIAAQFGDLSNLSVHGLNMSGYSAYIDNLYMRGAMQSLDGMFRLDTRTKELLLADPVSGLGLAFSSAQGLKIGKVYDALTGQFAKVIDLEQMQADIDDLGYLGKALHNDTQIAGGLIQSSLLRMGYVDEASGKWIPKAGTSGIYDPSKIGGGIAAWYGGDMLDKADYFYWNQDAYEWVLKPGVTPPENIAQGLDRMDGTGYRAGGNFWWDAMGNLHADPMSFFIGENTVGNVLQLFRYNFRSGATDQSFKNVESVTPMRPFTQLQIGEALIEWDAAEDGIKIIRADGKPAGLCATKYVSSKGPGNGGTGDGGSATTLGGLVNVDDAADLKPLNDRVLVQVAGSTHWTTKSLAAIAGLDTEALANYLSANKYATQTWVESRGYALASALAEHADDTTIHITAAERTKWNKVVTDLAAITGADADNIINKWEEIVAFLDTYTEADTLAALLGNKADKSVTISAGAGLTGGGTLAANRTLALAASGVTVGTYTKVTVDTYGRVTAGAALAAGDIPSLAISKVTGLQAKLDAKLDAETFNDFFEKVNVGTTASPRWAIRAKLGLYSDEFVSSKGPGNGGTDDGVVGATALTQLSDVSLATPIPGDVLQFNGQKWTNVAMSTLRPDLTGYATQQWVKDQGYLTSHQSLAGYVTLNTAQTITAAKTFAAIVYRKTNTLVRTVFNSDTGQDYLIFGDTAGYTYLRGDTIGFQNSLGKTNVTIANDGVLTAVKLAKSGGTASQILMADGSVKALSDITSAYVTALGTSNNYLTWTKNGVTGNITVPYATTAAYAGAVRDPEHYTISTRRGSANINFNNDAGLRHFLATTSMVTGKPMNDGHIIHMEWDNSLSWASQIAVPNSPSASMQWRAQNGTAWGDWTTLLDTDNYTKYVARRSSDGAVDLNTMNGVGFLSNDLNDNATAARHYPIREAGLLIYGNAAYSSANQIYGSYNSNRWFARGGGASTTGKTAWREFAFLDSNVASASELATARTLWGQSFDGSGNVSGNMTGVGSISFANGASAANIDTYGNFKIGTSGVRWTVKNSNNICGLCVLNSNGYVGINTEFPSQMLHVDGNVLVSGEAYYRTEGRAGNSWNNGYGALSVGIYDNDHQTPLLVAYRYNDGDWTTPHANRLFAMELLNSGSVLRFGFGGAAKFYFEKDGTFHTENGLWAAQYVSSKGASASSDVRLKCALEPLTLTLEQIAEAPAVRYRWRDTGEVDLGSTAQYWLRILPEGVRTQPNGYYGMAYDKIALVAAVTIARKSLDHERRIATLERENRELKKRLNQLKAA